MRPKTDQACIETGILPCLPNENGAREGRRLHSVHEIEAQLNRPEAWASMV